MADHGKHTPAPAFRASLEAQLVEALRSDVQQAPPSLMVSPRRAPRWRAAALLAAGLLLGVGGEFAAGQVQDSRQRSEIVATLTSQRDLASMKLDLARLELQLTKKRFDAGVLSSASLVTAESAMRAQEAELARLAIDLEEAQLTSAAPRDELWAPLVKGRDFVLERLRLAQQSANQQINAAKAAVDETDRGVRMGVLTQSRLTEMQLALMSAQDAVELLSQKELLRRECLEKHMSANDATRRLQRISLDSDVRRAQRELGLAQERLAIATEQFRRGILSELDVKKLEVSILEHHAEMQRLLSLMRVLDSYLQRKN